MSCSLIAGVGTADDSLGQHHHRLQYSKDWSEFVFLGNSLLEFWLMFKVGEHHNVILDHPAQKADLQFRLSSYWDGNSSLPVQAKCEAEPRSFYCASDFYRAFPNAINVARAGWTVSTWISRMRSREYAFERIANLPYIKYVVILLGRADLAGITPDQLVLNFKELLSVLNAMFPRAKLLLCSIAPRPVPWSRGHEIRWNTNITLTYETLAAHYSDRNKFPYVHVIDPCRDFYDRHTNLIHKRYFNDERHYNNLGFTLFEYAMKREVASIVS